MFSLHGYLLKIVFLFILFGAPFSVALADADLYVQKIIANTLAEEGIHQGEYVEYLVTYRNNGSETAKNVLLEDYYGGTTDFYEFRIPKNCTDTGKKITCQLGDVEPGIDKNIQYAARVSVGARPGFATSYVSLTSPTPDRDIYDNRTSVRFRVLLSEKSGMFSFQDAQEDFQDSSKNAFVNVQAVSDAISAADFQKDTLLIDIRPDENLFIGPAVIPKDSSSSKKAEKNTPLQEWDNIQNETSSSEVAKTTIPVVLASSETLSPKTGMSNMVTFALGLFSLFFGATFLLARRKSIVEV